MYVWLSVEKVDTLSYSPKSTHLKSSFLNRLHYQLIGHFVINNQSKVFELCHRKYLLRIEHLNLIERLEWSDFSTRFLRRCFFCARQKKPIIITSIVVFTVLFISIYFWKNKISYRDYALLCHSPMVWRVILKPSVKNVVFSFVALIDFINSEQNVRNKANKKLIHVSSSLEHSQSMIYDD